jgi:hypothetical protein
VGTLSNAQLSSLSNQVQLLASSNSTDSTAIASLSNSSFTTIQSFSNEIYAKNQSNLTSITWTLNALPSYAPLTIGQFSSNTSTYGSNCSIFSSNAAVAAQTTANFGCNASVFGSNYSVWTSNNFSNVSTTTSLATFSNFASPIAVFGSNLFPSICNLGNAYLGTSNSLFPSLCNLSNAYVSTSNSLFPSLCNLSNAYVSTSNNLFPSVCNLSNAYVSTSNNLFPSLCNLSNAYVNTSNSVTTKATFGSNTSVFSSNSLSNYRAKSASVPWTEVSGKPDFSSDGAGNDSLGAAGVTIGLAGLLMSGYNLLDKNDKLTNALSDAFGKMTIDPTGYFKLNDPGSYIDIGDSTTRVSKDRLLFKTETFSNMILNPGSLSYSNAIFTLCNQIALTATSISNLTNVSCSSNLTATGTISTTSNIGIGTTTPCYGLEINKTLPNIGLVWGALNKGRINFSYNGDPTISAGACARIEATDDVNCGG